MLKSRLTTIFINLSTIGMLAPAVVFGAPIVPNPVRGVQLLQGIAEAAAALDEIGLPAKEEFAIKLEGWHLRREEPFQFNDETLYLDAYTAEFENDLEEMDVSFCPGQDYLVVCGIRLGSVVDGPYDEDTVLAQMEDKLGLPAAACWNEYTRVYLLGEDGQRRPMPGCDGPGLPSVPGGELAMLHHADIYVSLRALAPDEGDVLYSLMLISGRLYTEALGTERKPIPSEWLPPPPLKF